ncbi:MAG: hypothetical protein HGA85_00515 [Nanoarchaeota archaeon]|nr:hypothetical protein [Nanoarchaeota archaeon]
MIHSKKAMEMEVIVKAVIALLILVILIGIVYIFVVKKAGGGINTINDETAIQGDDALNNLRGVLGSSCKSSDPPKCSISQKIMECVDGKWETTADPCEST